AFQNGTLYPIWADNSNSTGNNTNGTLNSFDVYTSKIAVIPAGQRGRYWALAGAGQGASGFDFGQHDFTPPTAQVTAVSPNPRSTPVGQLNLVFSEPVIGFDASKLRLSLNGGPNLLTVAQTLTTVDNTRFFLGNLAGITAARGTYTLTIAGSGSGIQDATG